MRVRHPVLLVVLMVILTGCASAKQSVFYPATLTIGTANHSETGQIVGVTGSLTWQLK